MIPRHGYHRALARSGQRKDPASSGIYCRTFGCAPAAAVRISAVNAVAWCAAICGAPVSGEYFLVRFHCYLAMAKVAGQCVF